MIGDVVQGQLARFRAEAESMMVDTITITRGSTRATDPATGVVTTTPTQVYSGKARIRPETSVTAGEQNAGEARDLLPGVVVSAPLSVAAQANDTITVTASADPGLMNARLRVISVDYGAQITARRMHCRIEKIGS